MKENKKIPLITSTIFALCIGGVTITNFWVALVPILMSEDTIKNKLKKIIIPSMIIALVMVYIQYKYDFIEDIIIRMRAFRPKGYSIINVISLFFGSSILLPNVIDGIITINSKNHTVVILDSYKYLWQYFVVVSIYIYSTYVIYKGYYKKIILFPAIILLYNIFIYIVIKYGLTETFIYGGHWVYIIPVLLGWSVFYLERKKHFQYIIYPLYVGFLIIIINNMIEFNNLIDLAKHYLPRY